MTVFSRSTRFKGFAPLIAAAIVVLLSVHLKADEIPIRTVRGLKYVSFHNLTERLGLQKNFDVLTQKCKVYHERHLAVFNVNLSVFIIDGELYRSDYAVIRDRGEVLIPLEAVRTILGSFYRNTVMNEQGDSITVDKGDAVTDNIINKGDKDVRQYTVPGEDKIGFIVIDPGHGGKDPGAIGKGGIHEKKITLDVGRILAEKLTGRIKDVKIILTRKGDSFIPLSRRTELANSRLKKKVNGIFLSIHVNASLSRKITGYETYFLSQNPTNEDARNTAALENNVIILEEKADSDKSHGDIDYIEAMMLTTQIQKESALLAESIQNGIGNMVKESKSRGVKKADFFVLRGVLMPASLVEIGYITNTRESALLLKRSYQAQVAEGIARGVANFIQRYNRIIRDTQKNP